MRQHAPVRPERLEVEPREEPPLRALEARARDDVGLLVDVDRDLGILAQRAIRPPGGERPGHPPIPLVGILAGLAERQVEPDRVARAPCQQRLAQVRADHVVRRRDDGAEAADDLGVEAERAERADLGQRVPLERWPDAGRSARVDG